MTISTHKVEVVPVVLEKHPNADSLSVVRVFGYTCLVRSQDWADVKTAAWIPPDSLVPVNRPEFAFLADKAKADGLARVRAKKLRGVVSYGLLVPAPPNTTLSDDVAEILGVTHYEPPSEFEGASKGGIFLKGDVASPPCVLAPKFDVDSFQRYPYLFKPGESVLITEKLDGCNSRYVYSVRDGMYCGSRNEWKREYPNFDHVPKHLKDAGKTQDEIDSIMATLESKSKRKNIWWDTLEKTPSLEKFCRNHPGLVVYGEIFGSVNHIKYGLPDGNRFCAFDILKEGKWMDVLESWSVGISLPWVPIACSGTVPLSYSYSYDFDLVMSLAEGVSLVPGAKAGTIREGVVVKPIKERWDPVAGRICFKAVNPTYLEKY